MLMKDKIIEKYWELYKTEQISIVDDSSLFVLFKSDFSLPSIESLNGIPRVVGYWPREHQVKLYNPNTRRVANAVVLSKREVAKILTSKSFNYYRVEYYILFKFFIIDKSELKKKNPDEFNQDKIKENEMIKTITTNKLIVDELCNFALVLSDYLMKKVVFQSKLMENGFKKLFINVQLSFIQNIMWMFFNQILDLKPETWKFITKNIFRLLSLYVLF
ncbi:hypothetical protein [Spiroplasma endosymbiont of Nebria brevicollis]|uniref:hypothetical protein n=1 Tax=Spiroplasma endosymbiont of Nebria brevicollis TaxID=3066284 RepID=UPI00313D1EB0